MYVILLLKVIQEVDEPAAQRDCAGDTSTEVMWTSKILEHAASAAFNKLHDAVLQDTM